MSEFIWIASFPKSGSTWLRFIVSHLMVDMDGHKGLVREIVPNIHDWTGGLRFPWHGAHAAKTHLKYDNLPPRMKTRSAIYVVRNPLDVVDSAISYLAPQSEEQKEKIVESFVEQGSVEPWLDTLGYGSWQENVQSWTREKRDFPLLVLRYEDILDDASKLISMVADFLDVDVDEKKIEWVKDQTAFSSMKKTEKAEIQAGSKGVFTDERLFDKKEFNFMRKGKAGGYSDSLTDKQVADLTAGFGQSMKNFNYA